MDLTINPYLGKCFLTRFSLPKLFDFLIQLSSIIWLLSDMIGNGGGPFLEVLYYA